MGDIALAQKKQSIGWRLEFGWRFWVTFLFVGIAIMFAKEGQLFWVFIASTAGVLFAENNGKYIERKKAEREHTEIGNARPGVAPAKPNDAL